jgi:hypothetical protein
MWYRDVVTKYHESVILRGDMSQDLPLENMLVEAYDKLYPRFGAEELHWEEMRQLGYTLNNIVVNKQVSGAQKSRLDLLVACLSLVVIYVSLAVTSLG